MTGEPRERVPESGAARTAARTVEQRVLLVHGTILTLGSGVFVAQVLAGRLGGVGVFSFLHESPLGTIGFLEGFLMATVIGLMLREASTLTVTWRWSLLAALVHVVLGAVNITQWSFFVELGATVPGTIATIAHGVLATLELAMARRSFASGRAR